MREAPSQEAFLARLEQEGLSAYSRDGKLTGVEVDGRKYRFKRTIGVDVENHPWDSYKNKSQETMASELALTNAASPRIEIAEKEEVEKNGPVESLPQKDEVQSLQSESQKSTQPVIDDIALEIEYSMPHHDNMDRSTQLSSLRQKKLEREREDSRSFNDRKP